MIYFRDNNGNEQLIAGIAGAGQTITQSITNGVTDKAPSSDAVYDYLAPVDITSSITPIANKAEWDSTGGAENKVYRIGNLVTVNIRFNTLTTAGYEAIISGFPVPKGTNKIVNFIYVRDTGNGCESGMGYIDGAGDVKLRIGTTYVGNYQTTVSFSYIAA